MLCSVRGLLIPLLLLGTGLAVPKSHAVNFGKWTVVKWFADTDTPLTLKVRPLYIDGRVKEFTFGLPHEVTDRLFVVRRAFRVNDAMPEEAAGSARWEWQPGGWLLVDRATGHVSQIVLPEFDPYYSTVSWYRDYVAYCGISDDGKKLYGVVNQLGRRKAVLKKPLGEVNTDDIPGAGCPAPSWQRLPARVTFAQGKAQSVTYAIRGHAVEVVSEEEESDKGTE